MLNTHTGELGGVFKVVAHGKVAVISWKNVKRRNAFDKKLARDLRSIIEKIGVGTVFHTILLDPGVGVFCSGWDLDEIRTVRGGSAEECGLLIDQGRELLSRFSDGHGHKKPLCTFEMYIIDISHPLAHPVMRASAFNETPLGRLPPEPQTAWFYFLPRRALTPADRASSACRESSQSKQASVMLWP